MNPVLPSSRPHHGITGTSGTAVDTLARAMVGSTTGGATRVRIEEKPVQFRGSRGRASRAAGATAMAAAVIGGLRGGAPGAAAAPGAPTAPGASATDRESDGGLPPVWPRPQSLRAQGAGVSVGREVTLVADADSDPYALDALRALLHDAGARVVGEATEPTAVGQRRA